MVGLTGPSRADAEALDASNPLAGFRDRFVGLDDRPYLLGHSLGPLSRRTRDRLAQLTDDGWGGRRAQGWSEWLDLPTGVGDRLGALIGAAPGQVALGDSTSVQLYKLTAAAVAARPHTEAVAVAADEFATDRYVVAGVADSHRREVRTVATDGPDGPITADTVDEACADGAVALVVASLVRFRTGAMADLNSVTEAAHRRGALMLWDLSHAVGAVPIELDRAGADLAVGSTYKYLNAGPGAPAFAYRASRHAGDLPQPIHGWFGHADQFEMGDAYRPHRDARQLVVGTPPVAGLIAVDEGLALHEEAGIGALRRASLAQTDFAIDHAEAVLAPLGVAVTTPRAAVRRGSHVALRHPGAAALVEHLLAEGVVVDHRRPDVIRLAAAPLHTRFVDLWDAIEALRTLLSR